MLIPALFFILLSLLNTLRINSVKNQFQQSQYDSIEADMRIIVDNAHKISDSIFDNLINTRQVIDIFKEADRADDAQKKVIRSKLYNLLKSDYQTFTKYGIQQLHFHLPNNESFLRFHKPHRFGDNLTGIRESVMYVNRYHQPIAGFEEGKIFNAYRFVYPLFDPEGNPIGSVEVSSSLLTFKKIFEQNQKKHIDFILTRQTVESKVFASERANYKPYYSSHEFFIQSTLKTYNNQELMHSKVQKLLQSQTIETDLLPIRKQIRTYFFDSRFYTVFLIPLHNDFTHTKVGYVVVVGESEFLHYFLNFIIISYLVILALSVLVAYSIYKERSYIAEVIENERLKHETFTDELTGLHNRKLYNQKLSEHIQLHKRYDLSFSMIMFDIDFFKAINDTHGHEVGDRVLIRLGKLILSLIRESDYIFRIGGEEFMIIAPQTDIRFAVVLAEKIRSSVERFLKVIPGKTITISLGVTEHRPGESADDIFKRVDGYLYLSKQGGRNKVTSDLGSMENQKE